MKKLIERKGQVAMEYLLTYGWALLIVVVIMGILYSTVFKPESYTIERCEMAPGLDCNPALIILEKTGTKLEDLKLTMNLTNSMGYGIRVTYINLTIEGTTKGFDGYDGNSYIPIDEWIDGSSEELWLRWPGKGKIMESGKLTKINFAMEYEIIETGSSHRTAGIINTRVE